MSLEMLEGLPYGPQTDVFSFGVLMWEVVAEELPDLLLQEKKRGPMVGCETYYYLMHDYCHDYSRLLPAPFRVWNAML